jgi:hypothetical protein
VTRRYERAALFGGMSAEAYLARLPPKVPREQRRRGKRLAELGAIAFERPNRDADFDGWVDEFLQLEQSGWKGKAGVAAAADPSLAAMLRARLAKALAAGRLDMRRMRVANGRSACRSTSPPDDRRYRSRSPMTRIMRASRRA